MVLGGFLDQGSRVHLQAFGRQVIFVLLCSLPMLLIDKHRPELCLFMMRAMFGFSALFVFITALLTRQPLSRGKIGIWDHFAGMLLLALLSSIALQSLH
jgi:hypothetical protein